MDFLWGAATSSHQIEGGNVHNDWWQWEQAGMCEGGARSGIATDHWNRFREDLRLAADLGLNSYRFSVEWSRIEPKEGRWNEEALEWYRELINECEKLKLLPMLTLHHFTSPLWFAEQGGFANEKASEKFVGYTEKVVRTLGARVPLWCTLNEPMVLVAGTYLGKFMPPGQFSPKHASLACHHLLKSHALAYERIHQLIETRQGPWKNHPIMVGIAHNMIDFKPDRRWHPIENILTRVFRRFYNRAWLDAVTGKKQHFGVTGIIPYAAQVREALGKKTADFIGINYYTKAYVQWRPKAPAQESPAELPLGLAFARRMETVSDMGWAIHPQGLKKMIESVSNYRLPIYITENGIADRDDRLRERFLKEHLRVISEARQNGIDLRGYYYWSLLDNFEWIKGFGPRFGLYRVDYETLARTINPSALILKNLIQS